MRRPAAVTLSDFYLRSPPQGLAVSRGIVGFRFSTQPTCGSFAAKCCYGISLIGQKACPKETVSKEENL
jgi:hypothetical protein